MSPQGVTPGSPEEAYEQMLQRMLDDLEREEAENPTPPLLSLGCLGDCDLCRALDKGPDDGNADCDFFDRLLAEPLSERQKAELERLMEIVCEDFSWSQPQIKLPPRIERVLDAEQNEELKELLKQRIEALDHQNQERVDAITIELKQWLQKNWLPRASEQN